jgi:hypothetical protein
LVVFLNFKSFRSQLFEDEFLSAFKIVYFHRLFR